MVVPDFSRWVQQGNSSRAELRCEKQIREKRSGYAARSRARLRWGLTLRAARRRSPPVGGRCRLRTMLRTIGGNAVQHSVGADVLIDVRPVHAVAIANELPIRALGRRRV